MTLKNADRAPLYNGRALVGVVPACANRSATVLGVRGGQKASKKSHVSRAISMGVSLLSARCGVDL